MSRHQVIVLPNGNVKVVSMLRGDARLAQQEYFRRGDLVYRILPSCAPLQVAARMDSKGTPLRIRAGEALQDTVRRALDERDGTRKPSHLRELCDAHPRAAKLCLGAAGTAAALFIAWVCLG